MAQKPIEVFFSYSREDKPLRDKLDKHLRSLKRLGVIKSWHDREILAGAEWEEEINHHIQTADIILLLISPDFIDSEYCYDIELPDAMARHEADEAYVVPILLRPVASWTKMPFAKLQVYPSGGKPVTQWSDQDNAFVDVTEGIEKAVNQLLESRRQQEHVLNEWLWRELPLKPEVQSELGRLQRLAGLSDADVRIRIDEIAEQRSQAAQAEAQKRQVEGAQRQAELARQERQKLAEAEQAQREREEQARQAAHQSFTIHLPDRTPLEMLAIPGGKFWMGSPDGVGYDSERPRHEVTIAPFFMSRFPITQEQYQALMCKNPSQSKGEKRPVECVTWHDAIAFCKELAGKESRRFSLPSEAQWEYACRAGTETAFYFGETISAEQVNYGTNKSGTTNVGIFPANKFGLHDMHGNVWEWCADYWHENYQGAPTDGSAWITTSKDSTRLLRGGSWFYYPDDCRSACRDHNSPDFQNLNIGFRVVCV
jgi:formylglycine-generating enzyme required for sulfatase activity